MRSRPMPVSIEGLGRSTRSPGPRCSYCMKTRFQNSRNRSPSSSALPGGPPATLSPWSRKISEQGPHGPVSPADQKLSDVAMRMILSSGEARHLLPDAVGVLVVVIDGDEQALLGSRPKSLVTSSQASGIASSLK